MNTYLGLILALFSSGIASQPVITSFNYATDIAAVETLIKKEWKHLFWMPAYDQSMITGIFKDLHPGDPAARAQHLYVTVLKDNEKLQGFITYYFSKPDTGHIELLCVDPESQGNGYGKKLLAYAEKFFKAHQCAGVQLYVYTYNEHAIEFYKRNGFIVKKKVPGCLLLCKEIKPQ